MIQAFIDKWNEEGRQYAETRLRAEHPANYAALVKIVVESLSGGAEYDDPDPDRIHEIDDGDYQGTLLFVIGDRGYQPSRYWCVKVSYGSCSGCDTLQSIGGYSGDKPTDEQVADYLTLALHIVQGLRAMQDD